MPKRPRVFFWEKSDRLCRVNYDVEGQGEIWYCKHCKGSGPEGIAIGAMSDGSEHEATPEHRAAIAKAFPDHKPEAIRAHLNPLAGPLDFE